MYDRAGNSRFPAGWKFAEMDIRKLLKFQGIPRSGHSPPKGGRVKPPLPPLARRDWRPSALVERGSARVARGRLHGMSTTAPAITANLLGIDGSFTEAEGRYLDAWEACAGDPEEIARRLPAGIVRIGSRSKEVARAIRAILRARLATEAGPRAVDAVVRSLTERDAENQPTAGQLRSARDVLDRLGIIPPKAAVEGAADRKPIRDLSAAELRQMVNDLESERLARDIERRTVTGRAEPA